MKPQSENSTKVGPKCTITKFSDFRKMNLLCIQISDRLPVRKTDIKMKINSYKFEPDEMFYSAVSGHD